MSNEYKEYLLDKVQELVLDYGAMDTIDEIKPTYCLERKYVYGQKNGQKVVVLVYLDDNTGDWVIEHRSAI